MILASLLSATAGSVSHLTHLTRAATRERRTLGFRKRTMPALWSIVGLLLGFAAVSVDAQVLRVMPMGDSITAGYRSTDNNGYRGELFNLLSPETSSLDFVGSLRDGTMRDADHEGHSGWTIDQVSNIATGVVQRYRPNLVTLHLGSNDLGKAGDEVAGAPARLAALIDKIFAAAPDATVVVASLIVNADPDTQSRINAYNQSIRSLVQQRSNTGAHVLMVDMSSLTVADLADGLHPNDGGYRKMAGVWNDGIEQAIGMGWVAPPVPVAMHLVGDQSGRCLDVTGGGQDDGTPVSIFSCAGGAANQLWTQQPDGTLTVYRGKCLDTLQGPVEGSVAGVRGCSGGAGQQWRLDPNGAIVGVQSGLCLDVNNMNTANGAKVTLWHCNGGSNQKWQLRG